MICSLFYYPILNFPQTSQTYIYIYNVGINIHILYNRYIHIKFVLYICIAMYIIYVYMLCIHILLNIYIYIYIYPAHMLSNWRNFPICLCNCFLFSLLKEMLQYSNFSFVFLKICPNSIILSYNWTCMFLYV